MNFSEALKALKSGKKIWRSSCDGLWIVLMGPLSLPPYNTQGTERKVNDRTAAWIGKDTPLKSGPYLASYNKDGQWQPGWIPRQEDLFGEDWNSE